MSLSGLTKATLIPSLAALTVAASAVLPLPSAQADVPPDFARLGGLPLSKEEAPRSWQAQREMIAIPASAYPLGRDDGAAEERPAHRVALAGFRVDRTEVTNAAFAEYLNALKLNVRGSFSAGEITARNAAGNGYDLLREGSEGSALYPIIALDDDQARIGFENGRFVPTAGYEDHPVTETTWAGARAYCLWRGARLPSEAEWEAAARGQDGRLYPWGDEAPSESRVFISRRTGVTARVGSRPEGASPFGLLDMSGSLAEWTSTLKRPYPYNAADGRETPELAGERVTRGGDYIYDSEPQRLTATHRDGFSNAPERGHRHIGFRCASSG
jgi:iron(II)-dependent oxidoreductase